MEEGEPVAILELEKGATFHLRRALAQMAGNSNLTRATWCRQYPDEAREIVAEYTPRMAALRSAIQAPAKGDAPTLTYLLGWLKTQLQRGIRVAVIDPITMMQTGNFGCKEHERFVAEAANLALRYAASIIVVCHPKRGMPGQPVLPCLENLPNSAAYERFSDTVLWLEWMAESEDMFKAPAPINTELKKFNRLLHCLKVRLDVNPRRIGFQFEGHTLRHVECGKLAE